MNQNPRAGITILEVLVVVAIIGILTTIGATGLRAPSTRLAANDYQALLQTARTEAVKRNRAVAVVWEPAEDAMLVRVAGTSRVIDCTPGAQVIRRLDVAQYRGVSVESREAANVVWLPSGQLRRCDGSLTGSTTSFQGGSGGHLVNVSAAGQIEVTAQ